MSAEVAHRAVDLLVAESKSARTLGILFFGGEPMMGFRTIKSVVEYAEQIASEHHKRFVYSMTTNGTLFTEANLAFLKAHNCSPLLSLDGIREVHDAHRKTRGGKGSFDLVMRGLPMLLKYFPNAEVRVTPHPDTVSRLYDSLRFLLSLGLRHFIIGPAHGVKWSHDDHRTFYEQMVRIIALQRRMEVEGDPFVLINFDRPRRNRGWGCRAGYGYIAVAADGTIYPCSYFIGQEELRDRTCMGDVWYGLNRPKVRAEFLLVNQQRLSRCQVCVHKDSCGGGCPGANFTMTGSLISPSSNHCREMGIFSRLWKFSVMYFSRGRGFGHATKDMTIVDELYKIYPGLTVQFVSYAKGAQALKKGGHKVISLELPERNPFFETTAKVVDLIRHHRPALVISHEEFAALPVAQYFGIPTVFITHWFLKSEDFAMRTLSYADTIIFIEREGIFEVPPYLADKVRYVGPVLRSFSYRKEDREQARRELGINPETKVVLVAPGAAWSEAVVPTFDLVFPAFEQMPFSNKLLLWLAGEDEASLRSKVDGRCDVVIKGTDWQIDRLMVASDLALTKSSYTTMCELDTLGIPSIALLHGHNPIDEIYAKRFPTVVPLELRTLSPEALSQTMESLLRTLPLVTSPCSPECHDLPSGAVQAAQVIVQFLSQVSHSSARSES